MDDPTKDLIPRSAVEYCLRKETVNTNPEAYEAHKKFIAYMDDPDISQFGHWMHSNGFNCALTSIAVDLDKIPSVMAKAEPRWIPVTERLPEDEYVLISKKPSKITGSKWSVDIAIRTADPRSGKIQWRDSRFGVIQDDKVLAWMPRPKPYREEGEQNAD